MVTGKVLWPNGLVVLEPLVTFRALPMAGSDRHPVQPYVDPWVDVGIPPEDEGRFKIEGLSEGTYVIVARKHVFGSSEEQFDATIKTGWWLTLAQFQVPRNEPLVLTLSSMESIHGRVSGPDGFGLRSFGVQAVPRNVRREFDDLRFYLPHDWRFESLDGSFAFVGLLPGEWEVSINENDYAKPVPRTIEVPWKQSVDFELVRSVELNGRIVDPTGEHLRGVAQATWTESGSSIAAGEASETTWGTGLFRFHVPPTTVVLRASFEGMESDPLVLDLTMRRTPDELQLVVPRRQ